MQNIPITKVLSALLQAILFISASQAQTQINNNNDVSKVRQYDVKTITQLSISSSINPATLTYLQRNYAKAKDGELFVIRLNTPGGLVTTTKSILKLMGSSQAPTVIWIGPEGASATSAGAIMASGAHKLYMNQATNIGAATPIQLSGDIPGKKSKKEDEKMAKSSDGRAKAINDLVALVKSLAQARGRNPEAFAKMVSKAASYSATEALDKNLIDKIVNNQNELLISLENQQITLMGQKLVLKLKNPKVNNVEMDSGMKLLNIFANPQTAYVLFLLGAALLYLEFQAAGGFVAGAMGAICLILAAIGFQVLPLNFGALMLMISSFILFVMEAFVTSYGILSILATAALVSGSLFLYRTEDSYITMSNSVIFASIAAIGSFLGLCLYLILKDQKNVGKVKFNDVTNKKAKILKVLDKGQDNYNYQVKVGGEIWQATSNESFIEKEEVTVSHQNNKEMKLELTK